MLGILFDNKTIYDHLSIFNTKTKETMLVIDSNEYDLPIKYAISNNHPIMNSILVQQLINEDCSLIISVSEFEDIPEVINIVSLYNTSLPFEPKMISFNKGISSSSASLNINNPTYGTIYTTTALDVHVLLLGVLKNSPIGYIQLGSLLKNNINAILKSELILGDQEKELFDQLEYRLLDTFKKVDNQLSNYTKLISNNTTNTQGGHND